MAEIDNNKDLFPGGDNPSIQELLNQISALNQTLHEQRQSINELTRNIGALNNNFKQELQAFSRLEESFNYAFERAFQRSYTQQAAYEGYSMYNMANNINKNFHSIAAEYLGQAAGLGAANLGIGATFNDQYAEFFGETAGRFLGREFGDFIKKSSGQHIESPTAQILSAQSPTANPMFAQVLVPELARQMDLQSLMFARGSLTFTGAAAQGSMMAVGFPLQYALFAPLTEPLNQIASTMDTFRQHIYGYMPIGTAVQEFMQILQTPPLTRYENIYQSKLLLASSLGGLPQANDVMNKALEKAREYPLQFGEILQAFRSLSVYPSVKPVLGDTSFQEKLLTAVSGLALINPQQGVGGALFSIVEALSGSQRSMQMRFNIDPDTIAQLAQMSKSEMSADPVALVEGLSRFVEKSVGKDILEKSRYTFTKQVENFEDALAIATKEIFEQSKIYPAITQAALAFQTSFAAMAQQPLSGQLLANLFRPVVSKLEETVANFIGIPTGMLRSTPMSQLEQLVEATFSNMSPEEYKERLKNFVEGLTDTFSTFKNQMKDILAPVKELAYSMFSDLGKAGAEILGESATAVIKGLLSNPISAAQFGIQFGLAMLPVMAGFKAMTHVFDRLMKQKITSDAVSDAIAQRQYELGLKKDPILEIQRKQQEAVAAYDKSLGLGKPSLQGFLPQSYINLMQGNIYGQPAPQQAAYQYQKMAGTAPGFATAYMRPQPLSDYERRIFNAIDKPIKDVFNRFEKFLKDGIVQERMRNSPEIRLALQELAMSGAYTNIYTMATLEGMLERAKVGAGRQGEQNIRELARITQDPMLRQTFERGLANIQRDLKAFGIDAQREDVAKNLGQLFQSFISKFGVGAAPIMRGIVSRTFSRIQNSEEYESASEVFKNPKTFTFELQKERNAILENLKEALPGMSRRDLQATYGGLTDVFDNDQEKISNVLNNLANINKQIGGSFKNEELSQYLQQEYSRGAVSRILSVQNIIKDLPEGSPLRKTYERSLFNISELESKIVNSVSEMSNTSEEERARKLSGLLQTLRAGVEPVIASFGNLNKTIQSLNLDDNLKKNIFYSLNSIQNAFNNQIKNLDISDPKQFYKQMASFSESYDRIIGEVMRSIYISPEKFVDLHRSILKEKINEAKDSGQDFDVKNLNIDAAKTAAERINIASDIRTGLSSIIGTFRAEELAQHVESGGTIGKGITAAAASLATFREKQMQGGGFMGLFDRFLMGQMGLYAASAIPGVGEYIDENLGYDNAMLLASGLSLASMFVKGEHLAGLLGKATNLPYLRNLPLLGRLGVIGGVAGAGYEGYQSFRELFTPGSLNEEALSNIQKSAFTASEYLNDAGISSEPGYKSEDLQEVYKKTEKEANSATRQTGTARTVGMVIGAILGGIIGRSAAGVALGAAAGGQIGSTFFGGDPDAITKPMSAQLTIVNQLGQQLSDLDEKIKQAEANPLTSKDVLANLYTQKEILQKRLKFEAGVAKESSYINKDDLDESLSSFSERYMNIQTSNGEDKFNNTAQLYVATAKKILNYEPDEIVDQLTEEVEVPDNMLSADPRFASVNLNTKNTIARQLTSSLSLLAKNAAEIPNEVAIETLKTTNAILNHLNPEQVSEAFGDNIKDMLVYANQQRITGFLIGNKDLEGAAQELEASIKSAVYAQPEKFAKAFNLKLSESDAKNPDKVQKEIESQLKTQQFNPSEMLSEEDRYKAESNINKQLSMFKTLTESPTRIIGNAEYIVSPSGRFLDKEKIEKSYQELANLAKKFQSGQPLTTEELNKFKEFEKTLAQSGIYSDPSQLFGKIEQSIRSMSSQAPYAQEQSFGVIKNQFMMLNNQLQSTKLVLQNQLSRVDEEIANTENQISQLSRQGNLDEKGRARLDKLTSKLKTLQDERQTILENIGQTDAYENIMRDAYIDFQVQRETMPLTELTKDFRRVHQLSMAQLAENAPYAFGLEMAGISLPSLARTLPPRMAPMIKEAANRGIQEILGADIPDFEKVKLLQQYLPFMNKEQYDAYMQIAVNTLKNPIKKNYLQDQQHNYGIETELPGDNGNLKQQNEIDKIFNEKNIFNTEKIQKLKSYVPYMSKEQYDAYVQMTSQEWNPNSNVPSISNTTKIPTADQLGQAQLNCAPLSSAQQYAPTVNQVEQAQQLASSSQVSGTAQKIHMSSPKAVPVVIPDTSQSNTILDFAKTVLSAPMSFLGQAYVSDVLTSLFDSKEKHIAPPENAYVALSKPAQQQTTTSSSSAEPSRFDNRRHTDTSVEVAKNVQTTAAAIANENYTFQIHLSV